jgi:hypothetical protein
MSLVSSTIVADRAVVRPQNGTNHSTILIAKNVRLEKRFGLTVVLTELTEVPDDHSLSIRRLNNGRRLYIGRDRYRGMRHLVECLRQINRFQMTLMSRSSRLGIVTLLGGC